MTDIRNVDAVDFTSFESALARAGHRALYIYVSDSIEHGWFSGGPFPGRQWYEDLVIVDRKRNERFLKEVGANEDFTLVGVSNGFVLFAAHSMDELVSSLKLVRPFTETLVNASVKAGRLTAPA